MKVYIEKLNELYKVKVGKKVFEVKGVAIYDARVSALLEKAKHVIVDAKAVVMLNNAVVIII